jgi:hypothetical protein
MKANHTHISLETAKLLKDCGIESKYWYYKNHAGIFIREKDKDKDIIEMFGHHWKDNWYYPAYTWSEILWEFPEKFFGKPFDFEDDTGDFTYHMATRDILHLLQHKQYDEADKYFRENCILTNE